MIPTANNCAGKASLVVPKVEEDSGRAERGGLEFLYWDSNLGKGGGGGPADSLCVVVQIGPQKGRRRLCLPSTQRGAALPRLFRL